MNNIPILKNFRHDLPPIGRIEFTDEVYNHLEKTLAKSLKPMLLHFAISEDANGKIEILNCSLDYIPDVPIYNKEIVSYFDKEDK
jgi:hypothetical protein